eukprot:CAMPEP_0119375352 /NCGR_PEP_ID=MMETSP1334-20130426/35319_1 /TAXON_ID=127549 /ORGANISM="Calcidiscus leptoporus, Strain RCC1130" /LENGTH=113 /DNA_ID=CAMNT_0007393641 /DNA_START=358 /DNA_END=697 /DNA_ORIENTATION=+
MQVCARTQATRSSPHSQTTADAFGQQTHVVTTGMANDHYVKSVTNRAAPPQRILQRGLADDEPESDLDPTWTRPGLDPDLTRTRRGPDVDLTRTRARIAPEKEHAVVADLKRT